MDTSETYIKLCMKAKEIQGLRYRECKPFTDAGKWHDDWRESYVAVEHHNKNKRWWQTSLYNFHNHLYADLVWLPRQDQLQEMVQIDTWQLEQGFHYWFLEHSGIKSFAPQFSMEQLWLAFVMKELYKKMWNGEDWENA